MLILLYPCTTPSLSPSQYRTSTVEYYREFYASDVCSTDPPACEWLKDRFRQNEEWVMSQVKAQGNKDPYWHVVGLYYKQMDGIFQGGCYGRTNCLAEPMCT